MWWVWFREVLNLLGCYNVCILKEILWFCVLVHGFWGLGVLDDVLIFYFMLVVSFIYYC